ncbi:MAG: hypothetical protein JXQ29_17995 [Planctomycetes bacterium]|nr:hypothetical protein [Planctomycetota bacterium]
MKRAGVLVCMVLAPAFGSPAAGQIPETDPQAASVWRQVEECQQQGLLRQMPELIRKLGALASAAVPLAARCHYEAARMHLRLGDAAAAARGFERALRGADGALGWRAASARARLALQAGDYSRAVEIVRTLQVSVRPGGACDAVRAAAVEVELARLHLRAGSPARALRHLERARIVGPDAEPELSQAASELRHETACLEGEAFEALGALAAAEHVYWRQFQDGPRTCAHDPRIPLALVRIAGACGGRERLRRTLELRVRGADPGLAASALLEYLDFKELIEAGNLPGLFAELEGLDPPPGSDGSGPAWPAVQAARDLVSRSPERARDAVLAHQARNGGFPLGACILGLVGDEPALAALYAMAVRETSPRALRHITAAIAGNRGGAAARFLERLASDGAAAHPVELRRAAEFALQSCAPVGQSLH